MVMGEIKKKILKMKDFEMNDLQKTRKALSDVIRYGDINILKPIDYINLETLITRLESELLYKELDFQRMQKEYNEYATR
jgi:hypothetical protein